MEKPIRILNRYTTLPVLLDVLKKRKLTLLDPRLWEDRNDAELMLEFKRRMKVKNLFVLCFASGDETVHHWKSFSAGSSGCVIEFDAPGLFKAFDQVPGLQRGRVKYVKLPELEGANKKVIALDAIPFTKRWPYRCEEEYRVLVTTDEDLAYYEVPIGIDTIRRITISQQMPESVFQTIKEHLKDLNQNPEGKVNRSTLFENKRWIKAFRNS